MAHIIWLRFQSGELHKTGIVKYDKRQKMRRQKCVGKLCFAGSRSDLLLAFSDNPSVTRFAVDFVLSL